MGKIIIPALVLGVVYYGYNWIFSTPVKYVESEYAVTTTNGVMYYGYSRNFGGALTDNVDATAKPGTPSTSDTGSTKTSIFNKRKEVGLGLGLGLTILGAGLGAHKYCSRNGEEPPSQTPGTSDPPSAPVVEPASVTVAPS